MKLSLSSRPYFHILKLLSTVTVLKANVRKISIILDWIKDLVPLISYKNVLHSYALLNIEIISYMNLSVLKSSWTNICNIQTTQLSPNFPIISQLSWIFIATIYIQLDNDSIFIDKIKENVF